MMLNNLWLTPQQIETLTAYARQASPQEACGVLGGNAAQGQVTEIIPITNIAADPVHFFQLDNTELANALLSLKAQNLQLLGFYHSHPRGDSRPSPVDIAAAHYPQAAMLIIGLGNNATEISAWQITSQEAHHLPLHIDATPPREIAPALSNAQKNAILITAILTFIIFMALALTLLPPAPPIPNP